MAKDTKNTPQELSSFTTGLAHTFSGLAIFAGIVQTTMGAMALLNGARGAAVVGNMIGGGINLASGIVGWQCAGAAVRERDRNHAARIEQEREESSEQTAARG